MFEHHFGPGVQDKASPGLLQPLHGREGLNPILFPLPSSPAASPAALAATGGLGGMTPKLATAGEAKSGHAGPAKTPEVASLALPARGAWGGMLYLKYRLVPCSSRAAGVVSRYSGLVNEARLLESTLFM